MKYRIFVLTSGNTISVEKSKRPTLTGGSYTFPDAVAKSGETQKNVEVPFHSVEYSYDSETPVVVKAKSKINLTELKPE